MMTTEDKATTEPRKWLPDPSDAPGPIQAKRVNQAISQLRAVDRSFIRLTGVHDQPETENRTVIYAPFSPPMHATAAKILEKIGARHDFTVSRANAAALAAEILAAIPEAREGMPTVDERRTADDVREQNERVEAFERDLEEKRAAAQAAWSKILDVVPKWANALIVAELDQDDCDSMTDYFGHKTTRRVVIGFRRSSRESFRELRAAAARFEPTAHLGPDAPAEVEHRDNYSMGSGNYLKAGHNHGSGWRVRSASIPTGTGSGADVYELAECATSTTSVAAGAVAGATGSARIEEHEHTKRRVTMFLVIPSHRVDRDTFDTLRDDCKARGGWYSRKWGRTPGGFAFLEIDEARAFLAAHFSDDEGPDDDGPKPDPEPESGPASVGVAIVAAACDDCRAPGELTTDDVGTDGLARCATCRADAEDQELECLPHGASVRLVAGDDDEGHRAEIAVGGTIRATCGPCHFFTVPEYTERSGRVPAPVRIGARASGSYQRLVYGWYVVMSSKINGIDYETTARYAPGFGCDYRRKADGDSERLPHAPDQYSTATPTGAHNVWTHRTKDDARRSATDAGREEIGRRLEVIADVLTEWSAGPDAAVLVAEERARVVAEAMERADDLERVAAEWREHASDLEKVDRLGHLPESTS